MTTSARTARSVSIPVLTLSLLAAAALAQTAAPVQRFAPARDFRAGTRSETATGFGHVPSVADPLRVVTSGTDRVVLEFTSPGHSTELTATGVSVRIPGCSNLAEPGQPDLPSRIVLVGIPQEGGVRVSAATEGSETEGGVTVRPIPAFDERQSAVAYQSGSYVPEPAAELVSIETIRRVRVARVRINPVRYDAVTGTLAFHDRVRVSLTFDRPPVSTGRPDPLDPVISGMLANGERAIDWKLDPTLQDTTNFFARSPVWCRIKTDSTAVYRVTPAELKAAGFDPAQIAPATMKLYSIGRYEINGPYPDTMVEVPVFVQDNGDAQFAKGEYLAFYAESPSYWRDGDSLWRTNVLTNNNCWWLTWGGANGRRIESVNAAPATVPSSIAERRARLEPDSVCPARSGLLWLWKDILKSQGIDTGSATLELALPERETILSVTGRFYGKTDKDGIIYNRTGLYLNGVFLDSIRVAAKRETPPATYFMLDSLPAEAAARPGRPDSLRIELRGDAEAEVFLDYVEVRYAERLRVTKAIPQIEFGFTSAAEFGIEGATGDALSLDVTDPWQPKRIAGTGTSGSLLTGRYEAAGFARVRCALLSGLRVPAEVVKRAPGNLRDPSVSADYYIVTPDEFAGAAALLVRYRQGNVPGLANARVQVALMSNIYDDYSFGVEEPGAIKKLLQAKEPSYVLLAGDATYDYRDVLRLKTSPWVPAYELGYDVDPEVYGNTAKAWDAWYADLEGSGGSPDLILGRVTVRSATEFRKFLDNLKRYESQPLGYWAKRFLLLSDDEYLGSPDRPDGIGFAHINANEEMARNTAGLLDPVKVYLTEYPLTNTNLKAEASAELIRQLNLGAVIWFFFGHGAGFQLNHEQTLHITNTVPSVNNGSRSPLAFYGSCGVGRFDDTRYESVAEELVRKDGGCIATIGATKATSPPYNETLARLLLAYLLDHRDQGIGPAFFSAYTQSDRLYHLFGDPATRLRLPVRGPDASVNPDTFYPGGRVEFAASDTVNGRGLYETSAREAVWHREYRSDMGSISYDLPGYEIHHGVGSYDSGVIRGAFYVPRVEYPETTNVPNGRYIREPASGRVSILSYDGAGAFSMQSHGVVLDTAFQPTDDNEPPEVSLYANDIRLVPGDTNRVPNDFTFTGVLSDPSGILLLPLPDVMLSMIRSGTRTPLAGYFNYDKNSSTTGRFSYPLKLGNKLDSITVVASDNMVDLSNPGPNRAFVSVVLETDLKDAVRLEDCLVYPNPVSGPARFTFSLSRPAAVSVKVFTISGRLVRYLPPRPCGFDYNEIEWDGTDKDGRALANGVYLYRLDARAVESGAGQSGAAGFRDKFVIFR